MRVNNNNNTFIWIRPKKTSITYCTICLKEKSQCFGFRLLNPDVDPGFWWIRIHVLDDLKFYNFTVENYSKCHNFLSSTSKHETSFFFVDHFAFLDLDPDPDSNTKHCLKTKLLKFHDSICCMLSKGDLQSISLDYRLSTAWEKTTVKRKM
jgi:hypothetical protein